MLARRFRKARRATLQNINPTGEHVWTFGDPCKSFDDAVYYDHLLGRFFGTRGQDVYFLSHPDSHRCMASQDCPFMN
jgi:hypothetical protein